MTADGAGQSETPVLWQYDVMRRWVLVAVALALVGAGCEGGASATVTVPAVSSTTPPTTETTVATTTTSTTVAMVASLTVPPLVATGVLPPVAAPGEVPYEPPGFVWGGEAAPLGLLRESFIDRAWYPDVVFTSYWPSFMARCTTLDPVPGVARYALVSGAYLGIEERQIWWPVGAETGSPTSHSVIVLVFDLGTPVGGLDPVVGRFLFADTADVDSPMLHTHLMNRRWLPDDPEIPPPGPHEYDVPYGGALWYEKLIDKRDPGLVVGRPYALELPIEWHPSVDCRYEYCGEEVTDPECREMDTAVKDMGFFEAENRAIVSALKGDAPLGDSTVGLVSTLHDPFPGRYDEPGAYNFADGLGWVDPADPFPPFDDFPLPPTFYFPGVNEHGIREWCHREGCTLIDVLVNSDEPEAYRRYLDALEKAEWAINEVGDGVVATSPDGLITLSILAPDHDLSQHLRSLDEPSDHLVLVSTWGPTVFRSDVEG